MYTVSGRQKAGVAGVSFERMFETVGAAD